MTAEGLNGRSFRTLLLVDFLPDPQQADPALRNRNVFVYRQARAVSRLHRITCPVPTPYVPGIFKFFYHLHGSEINFPGPRYGTDQAGIEFSTIRYLYLPRIYPHLKTAALLRRLDLWRREFDLVHCHTVYDLGLAGLEIRRKFGIPLVVTVYGTDVNWLFETDPARRASPRIAEATIRVLKGADAVIGVSRDLCAKVEKLGVSPEKIHHVPNGVDRELFFPGDRAAERGKLGWPPDKKIILYVGNLLETKGLGELVEAARLLGGDTGSGDFQVVLTGPDCGFENELRRRIAGYGLAGKILFTGALPPEDIPSLMRAADVFCLPSWREGWPNTVVEALACGLPVVATGVGGIPEMIREGENGLLVPLRDAWKLTEGLRKAITIDWIPERISVTAEPFYYDKLAMQISGIYRSIIREK